jgi:hypothetical protein
MTGWMIAVDGSAVNLARVERVTAEVRGDGTWYALARFGPMTSVALATDVVAWIEKHFHKARERMAWPAGEPMGTGASGGCGSVRFDHAAPPYGPYCRLISGHDGDHEYADEVENERDRGSRDKK